MCICDWIEKWAVAVARVCLTHWWTQRLVKVVILRFYSQRKNAELMAHGSMMSFQFRKREAGRRLASVVLSARCSTYGTSQLIPQTRQLGWGLDSLAGHCVPSGAPIWSPDLEVIRDNLLCVWVPACTHWGLLLAQGSALRLNSVLKSCFGCYFRPKTNKLRATREEGKKTDI